MANDIGSAGPDSPDHRAQAGAERQVLRDHVRSAWAEALAHNRFGDDDDFFQVGGHSLLIADIMVGLSARAGKRLSLRLFFEHPTVNELTDALAADGAFGSMAR